MRATPCGPGSGCCVQHLERSDTPGPICTSEDTTAHLRPHRNPIVERLPGEAKRLAETILCPTDPNDLEAEERRCFRGKLRFSFSYVRRLRGVTFCFSHLLYFMYNSTRSQGVPTQHFLVPHTGYTAAHGIVRKVRIWKYS